MGRLVVCWCSYNKALVGGLARLMLRDTVVLCLRIKAVGEPPLFLASSVFYAIKDAISAARYCPGPGLHAG